MTCAFSLHGVLLLLAALPAARAGHWPAAIEQADNYGRSNFLAVHRPLLGAWRQFILVVKREIRK